MVKHYHVPFLCCYSFFLPLQFDMLCISQFQTEDDSLAVETWPVPGIQIVEHSPLPPFFPSVQFNSLPTDSCALLSERLEQAIETCGLVSKPILFFSNYCESLSIFILPVAV